MLHLIPQPKKITLETTNLTAKTVTLATTLTDSRLEKAIKKLPLSENGIPLNITYENEASEAYTLTVSDEAITLNAKSPAGAFYGIQTLRQIFTHDTIPYLAIEDCPDFSYRGFYQDVTRGKVPKVETVKQLIDEMAYYKMNSLQLYVEHTFEFREYSDSIERTGYLTAEEIRELDDYCFENFIEFIPSLACFGHLYELMIKEPYRELNEIENFQPECCLYMERLMHHTIDPTHPKSFPLIQSLIDQYMPLFRTDKFNICCDETFDLPKGKHWNCDTGRLYIDFVKKLVNYVQQKGKKVMMWADILLKHPEVIEELPDGITYLNWWYETEVQEERISQFKTLNKSQIVCPCTASLDGLLEWPEKAEQNISNMANLGNRYEASGILTTNWGDYGTPASIDLSMYGMVLGAAKAWSVSTPVDTVYHTAVNHLLYQNENGYQYLSQLRMYQNMVPYNDIVRCYNNTFYPKRWPATLHPKPDMIAKVQQGCSAILNELKSQNWKREEFRKEMMIVAEGIIVIAELFALVSSYPITRITNTKAWLEKYSQSWLRKNKKSELSEMQTVYLALEEHYAK